LDGVEIPKHTQERGNETLKFNYQTSRLQSLSSLATLYSNCHINWSSWADNSKAGRCLQLRGLYGSLTPWLSNVTRCT